MYINFYKNKILCLNKQRLCCGSDGGGGAVWGCV